MLLTDIKEENATGNASCPPYHFNYDQRAIQNCFDATTNNTIGGIDHWGFYNGSQLINTYYTTRLPKPVTVNTSSGYQVIGIDREPNASYASIGLMTSVIFPTGGLNIFEYEPNDYRYAGTQQLASNKMAGGARITKITMADGEGNNIVKTYSYKSTVNPSLSSGVILNEPVYRFTQNGYTPANLYYSVAYMTELPINPIDLGYEQVTETSSDGSKMIYNYTTAKNFPYQFFPDDKSILAINTDIQIQFKWRFRRC